MIFRPEDPRFLEYVSV
uniref:Uncharacterized protein n=1 Tax=Rhizophora mucronata TaxID=61149 RepID=A0A2P2NJ34_RHIMU